MPEPVNRWQEVLHKIIFLDGLVNPKRIAYSLHRHAGYLGDICRRERVDPIAVANAILIDAQRHYPDNLAAFSAICGPIISLLLGGTNWTTSYVDSDIRRGVTYTRLCEQTGFLLKNLGDVIEAVARIEDDGVYDEKDDATIAEFNHKADQLSQRLGALAVELTRRRAARSPTP